MKPGVTITSVALDEADIRILKTYVSFLIMDNNNVVDVILMVHIRA